MGWGIGGGGVIRFEESSSSSSLTMSGVVRDGCDVEVGFWEEENAGGANLDADLIKFEELP